jgi:two-component system, OmpR family, sensor histidine kinase VicK
MPRFIGVILVFSYFISCTSSTNTTLLEKRREKENYYYPVNNEKYFNKQLAYTRMTEMVDSMYKNDNPKNFWSTYFYYAAHELIAYMKEQNVTALQYGDSAIAWIEKYKMQAEMPKDYGQMLLQRGRNYLSLGNIPQAYEWHYKASEFVEKYQDACGRAGYVHSLAGVLYTQGSFALAKEKYKEELKAAKQCPADQYYMHYGREQELLDNIGLCFLQLHEYDSAAFYFEEALVAVEKYKYLACDSVACLARYATNKGVILGNYAKVFIAKKQLPKAEDLYKQSIFLNTTLGYEKADAQLSMFQVSKVLIDQQKMKEAKQMLDKLKASLDTLPNIYALKGWNEMMSIYYAKQADPRNELYYFKAYIALKDSLEQSARVLKQNSLLSQLEDKKKEVKLSKLEVENKQTNSLLLWVLGGVFCLAVAVSVIFWFYKRTQKNNTLLSALNTTIQEQSLRNEGTLALLKESNKDKDRILKVVAHDLRNPISGLAALLNTLIEGDLEEERKLKIMQVAKDTSALSMHLIDELLKTDLEAIPLNYTVFSINDLLTDTISLVSDKASIKKQIIRAEKSSSCLVNADKERMQRVLLNLITNAIKFSNEGGIIDVNLLVKDNLTIISIKDEGIGIEEGVLQHIFDLKNTERKLGTALEESFGYGLPICKEIIEKHKGDIWVHSELGKGSTFYIAIPLSYNI